MNKVVGAPSPLLLHLVTSLTLPIGFAIQPCYILINVLCSAFLICVIATTSLAHKLEPIIIHVAVNGNDGNDGSAASQQADGVGPVQTFERARQLVHTLRNNKVPRGQPIEVLIRGGSYELDRPFTLGPEDSGEPDAPVIYRAQPGAKVHVTGGHLLSGWTGDPLWGATATFDPAVFAGRCPNQLFVNGNRRERPRLPAEGTFKIGQVAAPAVDGPPVTSHFFVRPGDLSKDFRPDSSTEVVVFDAWTASRMRATGYDPGTKQLNLQGSFAGHNRKRDFSIGLPYYIENPPVDHLKAGSWRCDLVSGRINYQPLLGEIPEEIEAVAPRIPQLLIIRGHNNTHVQNIAFKEITFEHTSWTLPPDGWAARQAEVGLPAAIELEHCKSIKFEHIEVRHTGAGGIRVGQNCSNVDVYRSSLQDLGGGGVAIGSDQRRPVRGSAWEGGNYGTAETHNINVTANKIQTLGRIHRGSVGVWSGQAHHVRIEDNIISDLFYSGISVGWVWNSGPSLSHDNYIVNNIIRNYGQGVLSDLGGIYTLGRQDRTIVAGNQIAEGLARTYGGWGLYADEGSSGISFRDNVIRGTSHAAIHVHKTAELLFERNVVSHFGEAAIRCTRPLADTSVLFRKNAVLKSNIPVTTGECHKSSYRFEEIVIQPTRPSLLSK